MSQQFITDVEDHRMKTAVEPAEKRIQLAVFRPHRKARELLLKDLAADLGQMLKRLVLDFPLRQEVNRWLPSKVPMSVAHSLDPLGAASPGMVARASLRSPNG